MPLTRSQIFSRSRDPRILLRIAASIGLAGLIAGFVISLFTAHSGHVPFLIDDPNSVQPDPLDYLPDAGAGFDQWGSFIRGLDFSEPDPEAEAREYSRWMSPGEPKRRSPDDLAREVSTAVDSAALPESERALLSDLLAVRRDPAGTEASAAIDRLKIASVREPPLEHAAATLGDARLDSRQFDEAIAAFQLELKRFPETADHALRQLSILFAMLGRTGERDELMDSDDFRERFSYSELLGRSVERRDWREILKYVILKDLVIADPWLALLSVFAAAVWFAIVTQFAGQRRGQMLIYAIAIVLGYFSATATLFTVILQNEFQGFDFDPLSDPTSQLIYCVAGIGLREETLKLLFFVPLALFLVRKGGEIDALVCAGLVGLGFALNENVSYVEASGPFTAWSRFLTANFVHIALTGIVGLALVRAIRRPKRQWDNFLYDFLIVVAAHGGYDALLMMPSLSEYSFGALIVFALVSYLFLDRAVELMRPLGAMRLSPLAVFVVGGALLIAVTFCFASWAMPFRSALSGFAMALAGVMPVAFVFIQRIRHL